MVDIDRRLGTAKGRTILSADSKGCLTMAAGFVPQAKHGNARLAARRLASEALVDPRVPHIAGHVSQSLGLQDQHGRLELGIKTFGDQIADVGALGGLFVLSPAQDVCLLAEIVGGLDLLRRRIDLDVGVDTPHLRAGTSMNEPTFLATGSLLLGGGKPVVLRGEL